MRILIILAIFLSIYNLKAQVGIGTTTPKAMLDINAETDLPALELNPQDTPTGSVTGQLAVIGDRLFLYDQDRSKWLSVETTLLNFGRESGNNNVFLEYVGDIQTLGPQMPQAGTIVYVSINSSGGKADKKLELYINNTMVANNDPATADAISIDGELQLSSNTFRTTRYNVDFNANDFIRVRVADDGGGASVRTDNITALLWVKWRN